MSSSHWGAAATTQQRSASLTGRQHAADGTAALRREGRILRMPWHFQGCHLLLKARQRTQKFALTRLDWYCLLMKLNFNNPMSSVEHAVDLAHTPA